MRAIKELNAVKNRKSQSARRHQPTHVRRSNPKSFASRPVDRWLRPTIHADRGLGGKAHGPGLRIRPCVFNEIWVCEVQAWGSSCNKLSACDFYDIQLRLHIFIFPFQLPIAFAHVNCCWTSIFQSRCFAEKQQTVPAPKCSPENSRIGRCFMYQACASKFIRLR
jgi:hypothetical protein